MYYQGQPLQWLSDDLKVFANKVACPVSFQARAAIAFFSLDEADKAVAAIKATSPDVKLQVKEVKVPVVRV